MHSRCPVLGKALSIALETPFKLSWHMVKMSSTSRFLRTVDLGPKALAFSVKEPQPQYFFMSFKVNPQNHVQTLKIIYSKTKPRGLNKKSLYSKLRINISDTVMGATVS